MRALFGAGAGRRMKKWSNGGGGGARKAAGETGAERRHWPRGEGERRRHWPRGARNRGGRKAKGASLARSLEKRSEEGDLDHDLEEGRCVLPFTG